MKRLYLCEKPSQGRDIAAVLGIKNKSNTHIEVENGFVSWGFGHLLEQFEPHEYDPKWADRYNWSALPILPDVIQIRPKVDREKNRSGKWIVKKVQGAKKQLDLIGKLMKEVDEIVISTDADREGESIGRNMLKWHQCRKPVKRLWLSALDPASVQKALGRLKEGSETINLYFASEGRAEADWLIGMNMSRALSIRNTTGKREHLSVGRIQTPTLWLVVKRDRDIKHFRSEAYFEILANVEADGKRVQLRYAPKDDLRILDKTKAQEICDSLNGFETALNVSKTAKKTKPPKPFSLAALQKKANARYGFSADETLSLAQALYEKHKYTTYPRSDCQFLPEEQIGEMQGILDNLSSLSEFSHVEWEQATARKEVYNTKKVTAHHALIPTGVKPDLSRLSDKEKKLYLLIAGQFVASLMPDYEFEQTQIKMVKDNMVFGITGNVPKVIGWKSVLGKEKEEGEGVLPAISDGSNGRVVSSEVDNKMTKPPAHYTDASLLEDMEKVGKYVTNPEHKKILKETSGLGTEATRAGILKTLQDRTFVEKKGKKILSTEKGRMLIDNLESNLPQLVDPGETAFWEQKLEEISSKGRQCKTEFITEIKSQIQKHLSYLEKNVTETKSEGAQDYKDTEETSWHKDFEGQTIVESVKGWKIPGYGYAGKSIAGMVMTLDLYRRLTSGEEISGTFKSKKGPFEAKLKYKKTKDIGLLKTDFVFADKETVAGDSTGVETEEYGVIEDCGTYYQAKNLKGVRFFKKLSGREMSAQDYKSILDTQIGVKFNKFVSKSNKIFEAVVRFSSKAKPYPKIEFVFDKKKRKK